MSEEIKDAGGVDLEASGDKSQTVSYESYSKVLSQRKSDQEKLKTLEEKLSGFQTKEQALVEEKLMEENKWREALELKNQQLEERLNKISELENSVASLNKEFDDATKLDAVARKLPGRLKSDKYYTFIDTSKIIVDPDTGALDETSVMNAANSFLKEHNSLIDIVKGKNPPGDSAASTTSFTTEQYKKMSLADKRKHLSAMVNKNS